MIVLRDKKYRFEQKEYGIVGNVRKYLVKRLDKGISKKFRDYQRASEIATNRTPAIVDSEVERKLATISNQPGVPVLNVSVLDRTNPTNYIATPSLEANDIRSLSGPIEEIERGVKLIGKSVIIHPSFSGSERLAHEYGHLNNAASKNPVVKYIESRANDNNTRQAIESTADSLYNSGNEPVYGIGEAFKRFVRSKYIINEESRANKKGVKYLKKAGVDSTVLRAAKNNLNQGLDTYRKIGSVHWRLPLRNSIAILKRDKNGNPIFDRIIPNTPGPKNLQ